MPDLELPHAAVGSEDTNSLRKNVSKVVSRQSPSSRGSSTTTSVTRAESSSPSSSAHASVTSFRNVSACHRCRVRKHRCDQRLPRCHSCERAGVPCVGYDPISKQEIPRSYIYFLERRVKYLSDVLLRHHIDFNPVVAYEEDHVGDDGETAVTPGPTVAPKLVAPHMTNCESKWQSNPRMHILSREGDTQSTATTASRGSSFSTSDPVSDRLIINLLFGRPTRRAIMARSRRCDYFENRSPSLHSYLSEFHAETTPENLTQVLPGYEHAELLVSSYLLHANSELPALQPGFLQQILIETYSDKASDRSAWALFLLFIVFAIGATLPRMPCSPYADSGMHRSWRRTTPSKRQKLWNKLASPEEFHSLAVIHLKRSMSSSSPDRLEKLTQLQALVLLAAFSLRKPTSPGLGFLVDAAICLARDLRLHRENDSDIPLNDPKQPGPPCGAHPHKDRLRDLRRRLWWCVYSLDRLVAPYLGRPFSIPDDVITTKFPSVLEDRLVEQPELSGPPRMVVGAQHESHHWVTLRVLQSEMHTVLQYRHTQAVRRTKSNSRDCEPPTCLRQHVSFCAWRLDMSRRLDEWRCRIPPSCHEGGPQQRTSLLMELEYWKSIIILYRWSVRFPSGLVGPSSSASTIFGHFLIETWEDPDYICFKVAEAARNALQLHRELQHASLVNATYLTAQDMFIAGIY